MMNRIKHSALFALLMVPAMAQASAAAADAKGKAEIHYDLYGNEVTKADAKRCFADLMKKKKSWDQTSAIRNAHPVQPASQKKNATVNPLSAWYKQNKALAGAIVGGLGFGAVAYAANSRNALTNVCIASTGALVGAAVSSGRKVTAAAMMGGALTGGLTYGSRGTGPAAVGVLCGAVAGTFMTNKSRKDNPRLNRWGRGVLVGGSLAGAATAIGYGTVCAPLAIPVFVGSLAVGAIAVANGE